MINHDQPLIILGTLIRQSHFSKVGIPGEFSWFWWKKLGRCVPCWMPGRWPYGIPSQLRWGCRLSEDKFGFARRHCKRIKAELLANVSLVSGGFTDFLSSWSQSIFAYFSGALKPPTRRYEKSYLFTKLPVSQEHLEQGVLLQWNCCAFSAICDLLRILQNDSVDHQCAALLGEGNIQNAWNRFIYIEWTHSYIYIHIISIDRSCIIYTHMRPVSC